MTASFEVLRSDIQGITTIAGLKSWGQKFRVEILDLPPGDQEMLRVKYRARVRELEEVKAF